MKILHIIESLSGVGGTPRKLLYLVKYSNPDKYNHVMVCYMPSPLKEEFQRYGSVVECLDTISPIKIFRHVIKSVERNNVDLICTHFTRPLLIGFFAAHFKRIPVIHNEHSSARYRKGWGRTLSRMLLPFTNAVTCNSHHTLKSIHQEFYVPTDKMIVLHNPVEKRISRVSEAELRSSLGFEADEIIIGHIGRMIPERDHICLIQAFSKLRKHNLKVRLVMIGDGNLRNELERSTIQLGLKQAVLYTGNTEKIGDYLKVMDLYVNPTLDEGFGIAVVEAMLEGLPVILTDRGAHPELVEDGVSGILYRGGDSRSLFKKLQKLVNDPDARQQIGARAKQRALKKFPPQRYAENFQKVASDVVSSFQAKHDKVRG